MPGGVAYAVRRLTSEDAAGVAGLVRRVHGATAWYLRGPYSPGLTRDAFAVVAAVNQGLNDSEGWDLDPASTERLQRLRPLLPGGLP
jgi:hypothetical protein